jgi:hypothetical protein
MILRELKPPGYFDQHEVGPWAAFLPSQTSQTSLQGCISQPAHAALAGRLANALNGKLFPAAPEKVIDAIGNHDAGWAGMDLHALEEASDSTPLSFVSISSKIAVQAWRKSISHAIRQSALSGYESFAAFWDSATYFLFTFARS